MWPSKAKQSDGSKGDHDETETNRPDDAVGVDGVDLNGTRHVFAGEQPGAVVSFGSKARTGAGGVAQRRI